MNLNLNFLEDPRTNWKYILIVVVAAILASGGVLIHYHRWTLRREIEVPKTKVEPSIRIISPSEGEEWKEGQVQKIRWDSQEVKKIDIILSVEEEKLEEIVSGEDTETKEYSWEVPEDLGTDLDPDKLDKLRIKIYSSEDSEISDESENFSLRMGDPLEQACVDSGGKVSTIQCWKRYEDFPGFYFPVCDSLPDQSREVKICICGLHKRFVDGKCVRFKEEVIEEVKADLKGKGEIQLVNLIKPVHETSEEEVYEGVVQIYKDESGEIMEWQSSPIDLWLSGATLRIVDNQAIGMPTIEVTWGVGAHGMGARLIAWTGSQFEEIGEFFSDSSVWLHESGQVSVSNRHPDCSVWGTIESIYEWNGSEYELVETIDYGCP